MYDGEIYYYIKNQHGDIAEIVDADGSTVVEYGYDEETQLYYLRSRYHDPEWGRFLNADTLLGVKGKLLSHNLFAYCKNVPVTYIDQEGHSAKTVEEEYPTTYYTKEYDGKKYKFQRYYVPPRKIDYSGIARVVDIGIAAAALYFSGSTALVAKKVAARTTKKKLAKKMISEAKKR